MKYIKKQKLLTKLGKGMEGSCYLSAKDNYAYKIIESNLFDYINNQYKIDEIITTQDINLNYFAIPEELYTISKRLIGYKTKYISSDLFDYYNLSKNYENMYKIDYELLIKAYDKIKEEVNKKNYKQYKNDLKCLNEYLEWFKQQKICNKNYHKRNTVTHIFKAVFIHSFINNSGFV